MAEISSPLSGGLRVARRTVSADIFTGRAVPPPTVSQPDPVTTSLISRNSLALNAVSGQLASISQQMVALNASLQNVFTNISVNTNLEKQQRLQDQNQEKVLAEQQLREGKESIIERKIQAALVFPVQKIAAKASFTLSRLMGFFTTLLGGWLLNQGIQTIKALSENNKEKLEQIKNNVLKNLGIIGGAYAAIRFGLVGLYNIITRVASKVGAAVATNLFLRPVQALLDGVKGAANRIIPKIKSLLPGFGKTSSPASIISGLATGTMDVMRGEEPTKAYTSNIAGSFGAAGLANLASKVPGPPLVKGAAGIAAFLTSYGPLVDLSKQGYDKITGMFSPAQGGPGVDMSAFSQPTEGKISSLSFGSNLDLMGKGKTEKVPGENQDFSKPAESGEISLSQIMGTQSESMDAIPVEMESIKMPSDFFESFDKAKLAPETQITPIKKETPIAQTVGPLPEPAPMVVPLPSPPPSQATAVPQPPSSSSPAMSVPTFPTSNTDNFYTLYSQIHYNVVI